MNYKIISIITIPTDDSGSLSYFEASRDISFCIKRIYFIANVPKDKKRGYHAHKKLKQLLFCPYGEVLITLDDGQLKDEILLNTPEKGILIEEPLWREILWIKDSSVLCVAASDYYDPNDYIRDYRDFLHYRNLLNTKRSSYMQEE